MSVVRHNVPLVGETRRVKMRTVKMAQYKLHFVNAHMYDRGSELYYRIGERNGYKALDLYQRCEKCMCDGGTCPYDHFVMCVDAGLTTGEAYEMVKAIRNVLNFV